MCVYVLLACDVGGVDVCLVYVGEACTYVACALTCSLYNYADLYICATCYVQIY